MKKTIFIAICAAMILGIAALTLPSLAKDKKTDQGASKKAPKAAEKASLEPWEAWEKYREPMAIISRQLGVTCVHCHNTRNYRDSSKKTHAIAKSHMEMVDTINEKYKNSFSAKIDCYVCHKGQAKPKFLEEKVKL